MGARFSGCAWKGARYRGFAWMGVKWCMIKSNPELRNAMCALFGNYTSRLDGR